MDATRLKKYQSQLQSRMPLIGGWLQGQAVRSLAEDGSAEAIRILESSAGDGENPSLQEQAVASLAALAKNANVAAQEALCRLVTYRDDPDALEIVRDAGYQPHEEMHRALFYFLTEQWDRYEKLDFDRQLLRQAYQAADAQLRKRIASRARAAGRVDWVDVAAGGKQGRRLSLMTPSEWDAAIDVLTAAKRGGDLWRLAQDAPPRMSVRILNRLHGLAWRPPAGPERDSFTELARLAKAWKDLDYSTFLHHRATLEGHTHDVRCLALRSGLLISGSADNTVRLWNTERARPLKTLTGHTGWVNDLAVTPDGALAASAGRDGRVCLWRLPGGRKIKTLRGKGSIFCLAMHPSGQVLAAGGADGIVRLWKLPDGKELAQLKGHEAGISCLAMSPGGDLLASGSGDSTIRLWTVPGGNSIARLAVHRADEGDGVLCLSVSRSGKLLAGGGTDGTIGVWSLPGGRLQKAIKGFGGAIGSLAITPNDRLLAAGGGDRGVRFWRLPGGRSLQPDDRFTGQPGCISISNDGKLLAGTGGGWDLDSTVKIWRLPGRKPVRTLRGHSRRVICLALSPDGRELFSGSGDGTIRIWSAEAARLASLPASKAALTDLNWAQQVLRTEGLEKAERAALELIVALLRRRMRTDILIDEVSPRRIEAGEFDIEIEG
jgi:WD40 repeat protein